MAAPVRNPKASGGLSPELEDYMFNHVREPEVGKKLRAATLKAVGKKAVMQITADEAQFFSFLVGLTGAKTAVEVGVFTGYSALSVAMALPDDGKLFALDVSEDFAAVGQPFWKEAGVDTKIGEHRAAKTLQTSPDVL